jgi:hypothetical protein
VPISATLLASILPASGTGAYPVQAIAKSGDWLLWCDNVGTVMCRYHIPSNTLYRNAGGDGELGWRPGTQNLSTAVVRSNGNVCFIRTSDMVADRLQRRCIVYEVVPSTGVTVDWQPPLSPLGTGAEWGAGSSDVAVVNDVAFDSQYAVGTGSGSLPMALTALDLSARTATRYQSLGGSDPNLWMRGSVYHNGSVWIIPQQAVPGFPTASTFYRVNPTTLATTTPVTYNEPMWTQQWAPSGVQTAVSVGDSIWWGARTSFNSSENNYWRLNTNTLEFDNIPGLRGSLLFSGTGRLDGTHAIFTGRGSARTDGGLWSFTSNPVEPTIVSSAADIVIPRTQFNHAPVNDGVVAYGVGYPSGIAEMYLWRLNFGPDEPPPPPPPLPPQPAPRRSGWHVGLYIGGKTELLSSAELMRIPGGVSVPQTGVLSFTFSGGPFPGRAQVAFIQMNHAADPPAFSRMPGWDYRGQVSNYYASGAFTWGLTLAAWSRVVPDVGGSNTTSTTFTGGAGAAASIGWMGEWDTPNIGDSFTGPADVYVASPVLPSPPANGASSGVVMLWGGRLPTGIMPYPPMVLDTANGHTLQGSLATTTGAGIVTWKQTSDEFGLALPQVDYLGANDILAWCSLGVIINER